MTLHEGVEGVEALIAAGSADAFTGLARWDRYTFSAEESSDLLSLKTESVFLCCDALTVEQVPDRCVSACDQ